jgi:hypothetical protein
LGPRVPAIQLVGGIDFTCARAPAGTVSCWGNDADGRLGDDDQPWSPAPIVVEIP